MARFVTVAQRDDIRAGFGKRIVIEKKELALFRIEDEFYAIENECPHYGAELCHGMIREKVVACPWHWWQFDITDGRCLTVPGMDVKSFPVRVENDEIQIELEDAPPPEIESKPETEANAETEVKLEPEAPSDSVSELETQAPTATQPA